MLGREPADERTNAEAYANLGRMNVEDDRFRDRIEQIASGWPPTNATLLPPTRVSTVSLDPMRG
jgi:hypothetical protein